MVFRFLYRGVLRYSVRDQKIAGDLMSCTLDTFPLVRCTMNKDALWSDGSAITISDVISSYDFFKKNTKNETTKSRLTLLDWQEDG